jgi:hypothetical protein
MKAIRTYAVRGCRRFITASDTPERDPAPPARAAPAHRNSLAS